MRLVMILAACALVCGCKKAPVLMIASEEPLAQGWQRVEYGSIILNLPGDWQFVDPKAEMKKLIGDMGNAGKGMFAPSEDFTLPGMENVKLVAGPKQEQDPQQTALLIRQLDDPPGSTSQEIADAMIKRAKANLGPGTTGNRENDAALPIGKAAVAKIKGLRSLFLTGQKPVNMTVYVLLHRRQATIFTFETEQADPAREHTFKRIMKTVRLKIK